MDAVPASMLRIQRRIAMRPKRHRLSILSLSTFLFAVGLLALSPPIHHVQSQTKTCKAGIPPDCIKVKSLGEDSSGCACFVCDPNGPNRKVICTTDEVAKKELRKRSQAG